MRRLLVLAACCAAPACSDEQPGAGAAGAGPALEAGGTSGAGALPAPPELPDGLVLETLTPGSGTDARVGDRLTVHFTGTLAATGEEFASTARSGVPYSFELGRGQVIEGWERGLVGVREGAEVRLEVDAALAYGDEAWGRVPAGSDLVFTLRVVKIE
jgi:FKBP-type peptidyl-prolyl cis-trans isomerase